MEVLYQMLKHHEIVSLAETSLVQFSSVQFFYFHTMIKIFKRHLKMALTICQNV